MSEQTKGKIRAVLEEHMGPAVVRDIGDQDSLIGRGIDWTVVAIGLETEFDVDVAELVIQTADTIDQIARFIDTLVLSKTTSPH